MNTILTNQYPIRYQAFETPSTWIENEHKRNSGGNEWVIYHEPVTNIDYPHIDDGIYIGITSFRGVACLLECHLTLPVKGRRQYNQTMICNYYDDALRIALEWLPQAQYKLKSSLLERELIPT